MAKVDPYASTEFMLRTTVGVVARAEALKDFVSKKMTKKAKRSDVLREAIAIGLHALEKQLEKEESQ